MASSCDAKGVTPSFERAPASAAEEQNEFLAGLTGLDWSFLIDDATPTPRSTTLLSAKGGGETELSAEAEAEARTEASIEEAIAAGHLPAAFRTALCERWLATGQCTASQCNFAHSVKERRVDAAIRLGRLPPAFKSRWCASWALTGACSRNARCYYAHSAEELRVKQQG